MMLGERRGTLTATKLAEAKMMKARSSRAMGEQTATSSRAKANEASGANGSSSQQAAAAAAAQARKRRSSINVYDQPSSLNSRLRQLETDMLRLDEDRTKLFDDTHSALTQYELKLGEIHAILKSRQDNVEKYVEDMKLLLQAKEDFEKQTKLLNDKHDRIHEKFMHRETIISREIKLLKNKFEVLERNRQFRSMLQKSNQMTSGDSNQANNDDLTSGLDGSSEFSRKRSETTTIQTGELDSSAGDRLRLSSSAAADLSRGGGGGTSAAVKSVRIQMSKLGGLSKLLGPLFGGAKRRRQRASTRMRRKSNKISSLEETTGGGGGGDESAMTQAAGAPLAGASLATSEPNTPMGASELQLNDTAPTSHLDPQQEQPAQQPPALAVSEPLEAPKTDGETQANDRQQPQAAKRASFMRRLFK